MDNRLSTEGEGSLRLQVSEAYSTSTTVQAPEKKLTLFAQRLAFLERAATGLGTLGFIWATVVLGGFAITLEKTDFWFITIILFMERARIFSRSHELEWQHQATWSLTKWVRLSRNTIKLLYWLQVLSATACVVLSSIKLIKQNFGEVAKGDIEKRNRHSALDIFYSSALAEALLFLTEKAYWEWKVSYCKLLEEVNSECGLGPSGMVSIKRFFYDAYSRCIAGSIFDGLKMDIVSFAMDLLASSSSDEQLIGVRILRQFAVNERFSDDTLQKIGITMSTVERLVDMLNWTGYKEEEIRLSATLVLSKLAGRKQNSLRIARIPGAMESISSILQTNRNLIPAGDEIGDKKLLLNHPNYRFRIFNNLGLLILKKLARDHGNCEKIGNTGGLLPKIINFTHAEEGLLKNERLTLPQVQTVKRSLQLVKMLASNTGTTGKHLRREISEIVITITNIRDILRYGEKYPFLQKLSIEIIICLALEEDAKERVGCTGGLLKELFNIFFKQSVAEHQKHVTIAAGEALAMLAFESEGNCHWILKLKVLERLVEAMKVPLVCINAAKILRNLCNYSGAECFDQLKGITAAAPPIFRAIMSEQNKLQEEMVGLAANIFKFKTSQESSIGFEEAGITKVDLAFKLIEILKKHQYPPTEVPRIRRFAVELAIRMMNDKVENIDIFKSLGMEEVLEGVLDTTSELENFIILSGTVGLKQHSITIHSLVETALNLLQERQNNSEQLS